MLTRRQQLPTEVTSRRHANEIDLTGYSNDRSGQPRSFLSSEENYQYIKMLHERNLIVPVSGAYEYEQLIPDARRVIFEDTGHVPMLERPARFNELVEEFLTE